MASEPLEDGRPSPAGPPGLVSAALLVAVPELRRTGLSSWQGGGHILTARPPTPPLRRPEQVAEGGIAFIKRRACRTCCHDAILLTPASACPRWSCQNPARRRNRKCDVCKQRLRAALGLAALAWSHLVHPAFVMRTSSCAPIRGVMRNAKFARVAPCRCCCCVPGIDVGAGGAHARHERANGFDGGAPERGAHEAAASRESKRGACQELECSGVTPSGYYYRIRCNKIHKTTEFTKRLGSCFQFRSRS